MAAKALNSSKGLLLAAFGCVFAVSGAVKALDPEAFAEAIFRYRLLPWTLCAALGLYLPWLELSAAICLFSRRSRRAASVLMLFLTCVFSWVLMISWFRGLDVECGCFGSDSPGIGWALARNAVLLLAGRTLLSRGADTPSVRGVHARPCDIAEEKRPWRIAERS